MVSAGYCARMASRRLPPSGRLVPKSMRPSRVKNAVKESFFSRINGEIAVRSMRASLSARAECIMPLINSNVIGSTCVVIASAPQQVDEQIAVDINHRLLAGKDHGGGVQLLDNGWSAHHVRCL